MHPGPGSQLADNTCNIKVGIEKLYVVQCLLHFICVCTDTDSNHTSKNHVKLVFK